MYVKVDELGTMVSADGLTYSAAVTGKDKYPVEIKLKDELAKVRIEDLQGNILIDKQTGELKGELEIEDGQTKEVKIIVTSQSETEKEYRLKIERISSKTDLESITVTDYNEDETETITRQVVTYDETTKTYKIIVNKNLRETEITAKAKTNEISIQLDEKRGETQTLQLVKALEGEGTNKTTIKLTAPDGTEEIRYLEIIQISSEIGIQKVEIDGIEIKANEGGDYEAAVTKEEDTAEIKVILKSKTAKVSVNGEREKVRQSTINISKGENRELRIPIKVTAEDGTTHTYTLTITILSNDTTVKEVKVNSTLANSEQTNNIYTAYIGKYESQGKIEITAGIPYSSVSHTAEDGTETKSKEKLSFTIDSSNLDQETYEETFKIIAEDGTEKEYNIEIRRKSDDNTIKAVYVNDIERQPNEGNENYKDGTYYAAVEGETAKIKIETNNEFATIEYKGKIGVGTLEQTIKLDKNNKITEIPVKITSQEGTEKHTTIYIEKITSNNGITTVKVNEKEVEKDEEGKYLAYIYETTKTSKIEITAESENITIIRTNKDGTNYQDENGQTTTGQGKLTIENIDTTEQATEIYFKAISETGRETETQTIRIEKMNTDTTLKEIYVDGKLITANEKGKYEANVLDTNQYPTIKAITTNENAYVRIEIGQEKQHIAEQTIALSDNKQTIIPITVRSQDGKTKVTYLYINKLSTSVELSTVTLNEKEENYYEETTSTYRFVVDSETTEFDFLVIAQSEFTTLEQDGTNKGNTIQEKINIGVEEEGKTIKVKAIAEAGNEKEYTIEIARASDNANLEYLKADGTARKPDATDKDTYTINIKAFQTEIEIEAKTEHSYATVKIGDNEKSTQISKVKVDCSNLYEDKIIIPIVVTASDGRTIKTYNVMLVRTGTIIEGKVKTENINDIHKALVSIYLTEDTREIGNEENPRQVMKQIETNEDGTFGIILEEGAICDLVITKKGYLTYTITNIEIEDEAIDLGEIELIAGDVAESGEIEIDDLVDINDNYGVIITEENEEEKSIYDLNEDGKVDMLDRVILKKNYGKIAEEIRWVKPNRRRRKMLGEDEVTGEVEENEQNTQTRENTDISILKSADGKILLARMELDYLVCPIACDYKISSNYGYRIHPTTGEKKLHAGIDLVGEHHTEILSIAEGTVTYAGTQNGYGNCIEIKHIVNGETIYSFYAHLSKINVKVGEKVRAGQIIGLEGGAKDDNNPGTSTGHHLHFEIRTASGSGHSVDPNNYIEF